MDFLRFVKADNKVIQSVALLHSVLGQRNARYENYLQYEKINPGDELVALKDGNFGIVLGKIDDDMDDLLDRPHMKSKSTRSKKTAKFGAVGQFTTD